jgi:hypothetical protein
VLPLVDEEYANHVACWERPPRKYDLKKDIPWVVLALFMDYVYKLISL